MTELVVALVGTDHHRFLRLVRWIDEAAVNHPDVSFVVQHGFTPPPLVAQGRAFMEHAAMRALLAEATVVVCHGGPGTITDAREAGHVPLCVPRDPRLGEHVDDHQQRFAVVASGAGIVCAVPTRAALRQELAGRLGRGVRRPAPPSDPARDSARELLAHELDALLDTRPYRLPRPRRAGVAAASVR